MPSDLKGWVIAGLGFALGVAGVQLLLGVVGRGLKA